MSRLAAHLLARDRLELLVATTLLEQPLQLQQLVLLLRLRHPGDVLAPRLYLLVPRDVLVQTSFALAHPRRRHGSFFLAVIGR